MWRYPLCLVSHLNRHVDGIVWNLTVAPGKPRHHALLGVLQTNVVVTASLAGCGTFLFVLGLGRINVRLDFGMGNFDKRNPPGHIGQTAFPNDAIRDFVCSQGCPYVCISGAQLVATQVSAQGQMLVEIEQESLNSLEIWCREIWCPKGRRLVQGFGIGHTDSIAGQRS